MDKEDWPDPNPVYTTLEILEETVDKRADEIIREITELKLEIEEQRWWRWFAAVPVSRTGVSHARTYARYGLRFGTGFGDLVSAKDIGGSAGTRAHHVYTSDIWLRPSQPNLANKCLSR